MVQQLSDLRYVGVDGVQLGFYDWKVDLDHFAETTLPLLKEVGLRVN